MASGEGYGFVQKEQLCPVATRHQGPLAPLPIEGAADPCVMRPPGGAKGLTFAVDDPAVAGQGTTRGYRDDLAGGKDAVLEGGRPRNAI